MLVIGSKVKGLLYEGVVTYEDLLQEESLGREGRGGDGSLGMRSVVRR